MPIADGPCEPTWKSLGDHFKPPAWWREAKIGMMAWPVEGKATIRSLAEGAGQITSVALLGNHAPLEWQQTGEGLIVNLPAEKPCQFAYGLKITGEHLTAVPVKAGVVSPAADGSLALTAEAAEPHGGVQAEMRVGQVNLGYWNNPQDWVSWQAKLTRPGKYHVTAQTASPNPGVPVALEAGGITLTGKAPRTASHDDYATLDFGTLEIEQPGLQTIKVRPADAAAWKPINLGRVLFQPENRP